MSVSSLRTPRRDLIDLKGRFEEALNHYDVLRDASELNVTRWQWASSALYDLDPLFFLDSHLVVGRPLASKPRDISCKVEYGFSISDQLLVEREFTEFPENSYHGIYTYLPDRIVGYRFHQTQSLAIVNCSQLILERSIPVCFQRWGARGWTSYSYKCTGTRIDSYTGMSRGEDEEMEQRFSANLVYVGGGLVEVWVKEGQRKSPKMSYRGILPSPSPFIRGHGGQQ